MKALQEGSKIRLLSGGEVKVIHGKLIHKKANQLQLARGRQDLINWFFHDNSVDDEFNS